MIKEFLFNNKYIAIFILFMNTSITDSFLESILINPSIISIIRLVTNMIFIVMIIYYLLTSRIKFKKYYISILFVGLMFFTIGWTPEKIESIKLYINIVGPICYFLLLTFIVGKEKILNIIYLYCNFIVILEIISLILPSRAGYTIANLLRGIHLSRSAFVVYLNFTILINIIYLLKTKKKYKRISVISIGFIVISLLLVVLSRSSTGILIVGIFILMPFILYRKEISYYIFNGVIAVGIILPMINISSPIIEGIMKGLFNKSLTFSGRKYIWEYVFNNIVENPILGNGFNSTYSLLDNKIIPIYNNVAAHSHNGFLEVFLQNGIIGLVLLVYILVFAYRSTEYLNKIEKIIFKSYLIVIVIFNFMEPFFNNQVSIVTLWLPIVYIVNSRYSIIKNSSRKLV